MPDTPPPVEEKEIVVTGVRLKTTDDPGGGDFFGYVTYTPRNILVFGESGGGEQFELVKIGMVDGGVHVRLPGYDALFRVPAADWARMSPEQRGEFIKMMTEFRESPGFIAILDSIQAGGGQDVVFRYDSVVHTPTGGTEPWNAGQYGEAKITYANNPDGTPGTTTITGIVININSLNVPGADGTHDMWTNTQGESVPITFGLVLAHELGHARYPGVTAGEEQQVRIDADQIVDDIFNTPSSFERSPLDYYNSETFVGSRHSDTSTGTSAGDTLSGLSGNDTLNGAGGDDLVMGGVGMDQLSGGTGSNLVMGGLDADTYVPAVGVTVEQVSDSGGVDRIDLSRFSIGDAQFSRYADTLMITIYGEQIVVDNHWVDANKVEQFTFADGTYAASYIEYLAESSGGGICWDGPNQVICGPYGLPVVLDLDGDGIELLEVTESRTRFDINGDGEWERIGWVGPDDGILALDRNANGRIDDFSEISFLRDFLGAGTDLEGLYAYDSDGDGFLTAADARFSDFLVWRDENGNGHSEKKELFSLDDLGIVSIGLERRDINPLDMDGKANQVLATSSFETADGRSQLVGDIALFAQIGCGCGGGGDTAQFRTVTTEGMIG